MAADKFLIAKSLRDFGDVVDALDAFDDDIEKGERWDTMREHGRERKAARRKLVDARRRYFADLAGARGRASERYIMAPTVNRNKREARRESKARERAEARSVKKAYLVPTEMIEKGLPSVQRAMLRAAEKTGDHSAINSHWAHSLKIRNKRIGQEVAGKPMSYLRGDRTTDPAKIARLKEIGVENAGRRKELANRNGGKIGLSPSKVNPGMSLKESSNALAGQREAALRARRPVQIRGGEVNKPAW